VHIEPSSGADDGQSAEFMKPPAPKPPPIELRPPVPPLELPPVETEPPVLLLLPLTPLPLGLLLVPATLAEVPPVPALLGVVPPEPLLSAPPSLLPPHAMNRPKLIEKSGKL
jgi:hypothetical protein